MSSFTGINAVVTGAASGIGLALAEGIEARGGKVLRADIHGDGVFRCDVSLPGQVEALAEEAWGRFGRVDLLINNAGIGGGGKRLEDTALADARRIFEVNFWGVWHGCHAFIPRLKEQDSPSAIYNVASENMLFCAVRRSPAYIASKHAVLGLTESLRGDLPAHVHAGTIVPGWVGTNINPPEVREVAMSAERFAEIALPQIAARERFVVTHAYNVVRMRERTEALEDAFARSAPRYEGDEEHDVPTFVERLRLARQA